MRRDALRARVAHTVRREFGDDIQEGGVVTAAALAKGIAVLLTPTLAPERFSLRLDGLKRVPGESSLGAFHYVPMVITAESRVRSVDRLLTEMLALLLAPYQQLMPGIGIIWLGGERGMTTIRIPANVIKAKSALAGLRRLVTSDTPPRLILNEHCPSCQFRTFCWEQAMRDDNLSLLGGLTPKDIGRYARKGILTITQLAYTFRPRRPRKGQSHPKRRQFALQALALRDQRIYVYGRPSCPSSAVEIYLDVESEPDAGFIYLIGCIVVTGDQVVQHTFWADTKAKELAIFEAFLAIVTQYDDYQVFCYGAFEREFLQRMSRTASRPELVVAILDRLTNVLALLYTHMYFPTYVNSLKEVGRCVGATWTAPNASGQQSIVWRARWVETGDPIWKETLITYNAEDCSALRRVADLVRAIATLGASESLPSPELGRPPITIVQEAEQLADYHTWRPVDYVHEDYAFINKHAYFDYQQERVYARSNPLLRKQQARKRASPNRHLPVTKRVTIVAQSCPSCGSKQVESGVKPTAYRYKPRLKRAFDLRISSSGVRRVVIEARTSVYRCLSCNKEFVPSEHHRLDKHFHGLKSWVIYQYVECRVSMMIIPKMIEELFGIRIFPTEIFMFKTLMAQMYAETAQQLLSHMLSGPLLHVDETEVKHQTGKGYVWVFASLDAVVYLYRPNREGEFLRELLKNFRGVLISDFYGVYDGFDCPQQKCLIHLMRDMNQELLNNPFDSDLKAITQAFGVLLRQIITTIDTHGLRQKYLQQHRDDVRRFFETLSAETSTSEAAENVRARLLKYREKLFTFLDHNDVPWNNNNAEHAIKQFAYFREQRNGSIQESGLKDYLTLLSVKQTCACRQISFLRFMGSKERDVNIYRERKRTPPHPFTLELYPEGFVPSHLMNKAKKAKKAEKPEERPAEDNKET